MSTLKKRQQVRHLHFVGMGGIGMSGIAEVFLNQGYRVSGSDLSESDSVQRLRNLGAEVHIGHRAENVRDAQVVVISSAVRPDNPEVLEARSRRIPVIPRAEMLGELMRGKTGIAVAGSHGKTTSTSMVAAILTQASLDPTVVVGGKVDALGGNAKLGQGDWVIAEADESDGSFLHLPATFAIITNIDNDHLDHYGTLQAIETAFVEFVAQLPFYGRAAVNGDDPGVRRCLSRFTKPITTFGFESSNDWSAEEVESLPFGSRFQVRCRGERLGAVEIRVPGRHNVLNALGALAIADAIGVSFEDAVSGLASYGGVKRRFEIRWRDDARKQMVVDDYGHHPTEVRATLAAARSAWDGRIVAVFQPHRYSRTLHCHDGFLSAFQGADVLLLTEIYAAGEEPIEGVSGEALAREVREAMPQTCEVHFVSDLDQALSKLGQISRSGDLILCMGAGSITRLPDRVPGVLRA